MNKLDATVKQLLAGSSSAIASGERDIALANLIEAIRLTRGEDMIVQTLSEARERNHEVQARMASARNQEIIEAALIASEELIKNDSILKQNGAQDILQDAFEDGSSVICGKCSALIKRSRWETHSTLWCTSLDSNAMESDDV